METRTFQVIAVSNPVHLFRWPCIFTSNPSKIQGVYLHASLKWEERVEVWVRWKVITHTVVFTNPFPYTSGHTGFTAANRLLASRLSCPSLICMQMHQQRSETNCESWDSSVVSAGRCKGLGMRVGCIKTAREVLSCNYFNFCVRKGMSKLKTLLKFS